VIGGNEIRSVSGISVLSVEEFINVNSSDDIYITAKTNLAVTTTSGIMSFKSGDKLNMKSAKAMHVKTEADGLLVESLSTSTWNSTGLVTENFDASHTNNTTGTLDLNVSDEVDIDSDLINLN
jgi:hypothetical protein